MALRCRHSGRDEVHLLACDDRASQKRWMSALLTAIAGNTCEVALRQGAGLSPYACPPPTRACNPAPVRPSDALRFTEHHTATRATHTRSTRRRAGKPGARPCAFDSLILPRRYEAATVNLLLGVLWTRIGLRQRAQGHWSKAAALMPRSLLLQGAVGWALAEHGVLRLASGDAEGRSPLKRGIKHLKRASMRSLEAARTAPEKEAALAALCETARLMAVHGSYAAASTLLQSLLRREPECWGCAGLALELEGYTSARPAASSTGASTLLNLTLADHRRRVADAEVEFAAPPADWSPAVLAPEDTAAVASMLRARRPAVLRSADDCAATEAQGSPMPGLFNWTANISHAATLLPVG